MEAKTGKNSPRTELPRSYSNKDIDDARIDRNIFKVYGKIISKRRRSTGQQGNGDGVNDM